MLDNRSNQKLFEILHIILKTTLHLSKTQPNRFLLYAYQ